MLADILLFSLFIYYIFFLEELPVLDNEMFYSTKPGLSAYVDSPEMVSSLSGLIGSIERRRAWKTSPGVSPCI